MARHNTKSTLTGALLLGALTTGALTAVGMGSAPAAQATCASFFGLGTSADCTSNLTSIAIAIGPNAQAHADGLFGGAFAIGAAPVISFLGGGISGVATATTSGAFTFANAAGDNVTANAGGLFGVAMQWGFDGQATTKGVANVAQGWTDPFGPQVANGFDTTLASGVGNVVTNAVLEVDGPGYSGEAVGVGNYAVNGWGINNNVQAGGTSTSFLNVALGIFSAGDVQAGPGPFAIAAGIQAPPGQATTRSHLGIHITFGGQTIIGGAAAVHPNTPAVAANHHPTATTAAAKTTSKKK